MRCRHFGDSLRSGKLEIHAEVDWISDQRCLLCVVCRLSCRFPADIKQGKKIAGLAAAESADKQIKWKDSARFIKKELG